MQETRFLFYKNSEIFLEARYIFKYFSGTCILSIPVGGIHDPQFEPHIKNKRRIIPASEFMAPYSNQVLHCNKLSRVETFAGTNFRGYKLSRVQTFTGRNFRERGKFWLNILIFMRILNFIPNFSLDVHIDFFLIKNVFFREFSILP